MSAITAEERAKRCAEIMWANDNASPFLGIEMDDVSPGKAKFHLEVKKHHTNGHDICHGGYIFTLADTTFAFACNTYNQNTVAQFCNIAFVAPGKLGDTLFANAVEVNRAGRSGTYDIRVTNQDDETIALFRGQSRTIRGQFFEEDK